MLSAFLCYGVCCLAFDVFCCLQGVDWSSWYVVSCMLLVCLLYVVCCLFLLFVVWCSRFVVVCCLLLVVVGCSVLLSVFVVSCF